MATTPSIKVTKSFTYQGVARRWSNRYHFNPSVPPDSTHWTTFSDAIVAAEKKIYNGAVTIVQTDGYAAGSDVPVFTKTYTTTGTGVADSGFTGLEQLPGDVAALIRYSTAARTPKNHPVFLFNYMHGALKASGGDPDTLLPTQKTAMTTYAGLWVSGISDGTTSMHRAGPNGATATGVVVKTFVTHRDFPRG